MKIPVKYVLLIIFLTILALLYTGYRIGHKGGERASQPTIDAQNSQIQRYVVRIGDDSLYIAQKEQEIKTLRQAKQDGDIRNEELRKLNLKQVNELSRIKLEVDSLLHVDHSGEIVIITKYVNVRDTTQKAILLPFSFNKNDHWLDLRGNFNSQGLLDIALKMDLSLDVWTGVTRKTKEYTTLITTDSPYINIIGIKSQKYDLPKPKPFGLGFSFGYAITRNGLSPFVGVGLNYSIIRF